MRKDKAVNFALFGAGTRGELDLGYFFAKNPNKIRYNAVAELDPFRRNEFIKRFNIPKENVFSDYKDFLEKPKLSDAIIIALPCRMHHDATIAALKAGYNVLLEKPMAHDPAECVHMVQAAGKYKRKLSIIFENRYNKIYQRAKKLLDDGIIGRLWDITCAEHIGYWHYTMSYVRGIHSLADEGNSFMIAKGIHDTDLITWFTGSKAKKVSCFGDLSYFNESNAPEGGPVRCTDECPVQETCMFDAMKHYYKPGKPAIPIPLILGQSLSNFLDYLRDPRFRTLASTITRDLSKPNILKTLKKSAHGKCVFRSDNSVTDHQTTNIEYENGVTCSFSLSAFSLVWERLFDLRGTNGEILTKDFSGRLEVRTFSPPKRMKKRIRYNGLHHGGGDKYLLLDFAEAVKSDDPDVKSLTSVENCVEAHLIALAAEESRLQNKIVVMSDFRRRAEEGARALDKKN